MVITTPHESYSVSIHNLITSCEVMNNLSLATQVSSIFLLVATYNHIIKKKIHESVIQSQQFYIFIVCSVCSICIYPIVQFAFWSYDGMLSAVVPQLVYQGECLIIA